MKIPRYIVIKLEMTDKTTVKATDVTDRCEVYEYEADEDEPQIDEEEVAKDINRRVEMIKKEWDIRHTETNVETMSCEECKHYVYQLGCTHHGNCAYEPKDEPQTERSE